MTLSKGRQDWNNVIQGLGPMGIRETLHPAAGEYPFFQKHMGHF